MSSNERFAKKATPLLQMAFDRSSPHVVAWAAKHVGESIDEITETTRKNIAAAVARAAEEGDLDQQYEDILDAVGDDERATLISKTEPMIAANQGQRQSWDQAVDNGLLPDDARREWIATDDPTTCPMCAELDGKVTTLDGQYPEPGGYGPILHPRCLPGDSLVLTVGLVSAASKRWFDGDVVVIRVSGGHVLTCTPNHPVLTPSGWVAAGLLNVGERVLCDSRVKWGGGGDRDYQEMPTRIQDIADTLLGSCEVPAIPVPTTTEDFHGDGIAGQIAIVGTDGKLWNDRNTVVRQPVSERDLVNTPLRISALRSVTQFVKACTSAAGSIVRVLDLGFALLLGQGCPPLFSRFAGELPDRVLAGVAGQRLAVFEGGRLVPSEFVFATSPQRDPSGGQLAQDRLVPAAPAPYPQTLNGLTFEVSTNDILSTERKHFSAHVYNLETEHGWYVAEGIITHNCRCTEGIVG